MDRPLSPPLKLLAERGNVASPVMMLMLKHANPLHTHSGLALALIHTRLPGNHFTTQAVGEDGRAGAKEWDLRVSTYTWPGSQGPGDCWRFVRCEKMMQAILEMVHSMKLEHFSQMFQFDMIVLMSNVFQIFLLFFLIVALLFNLLLTIFWMYYVMFSPKKSVWATEFHKIKPWK